jgi:hypothetical protein
MPHFQIHFCSWVLMLISSNSSAQDHALFLYPTFIGGWYTHDKTEVENGNPLLIADLPVIKNNTYAELRYNYDQLNTLGIYAGKRISIRKQVDEVLIPQIGLLAGAYTGASLQLYYQQLNRCYEINFQNQYGISFKNQAAVFFYF